MYTAVLIQPSHDKTVLYYLPLTLLGYLLLLPAGLLPAARANDFEPGICLP